MMRSTASVTSGPMPSPGMSVIVWVIAGPRRARRGARPVRRDLLEQSRSVSPNAARSWLSMSISPSTRPRVHDRHDDLGSCLEAAGEVARIGVHVVHDDRHLLGGRGTADAAAERDARVRGRLADEGPEHQLVAIEQVDADPVVRRAPRPRGSRRPAAMAASGSDAPAIAAPTRGARVESIAWFIGRPAFPSTRAPRRRRWRIPCSSVERPCSCPKVTRRRVVAREGRDGRANLAAHGANPPVHPEARGEHRREHRAGDGKRQSEAPRPGPDEGHARERHQHDRRPHVAHEVEAAQHLAHERRGIAGAQHGERRRRDDAADRDVAAQPDSEREDRHEAQRRHPAIIMTTPARLPGPRAATERQIRRCQTASSISTLSARAVPAASTGSTGALPRSSGRRVERKPVLLSITASWCHGCAVMDRHDVQRPGDRGGDQRALRPRPRRRRPPARHQRALQPRRLADDGVSDAVGRDPDGQHLRGAGQSCRACSCETVDGAALAVRRADGRAPTPLRGPARGAQPRTVRAGSPARPSGSPNTSLGSTTRCSAGSAATASS